MRLGPADIADQTDQPLRQNAVQRRNKVVRLDSHIQEPADHIHDVVGVDSGKDEVTGKRRLNGNLRGFRVTDFADHDLVRIVAQNGAKAAGEGQTFLFIYWNLRDAADLIFDRVFD